MKLWNHSCSMAPCVRMCSSTPRAHATSRLSARDAQLPIEGVLALGGVEHCAGDAGESRRLAGVDLHDRAAGLLQGAADAGLQAELQHCVEQQSAADPRPHPGGHVTGAVSRQNGANSFRSTRSGGMIR